MRKIVLKTQSKGSQWAAVTGSHAGVDYLLSERGPDYVIAQTDAGASMLASTLKSHGLVEGDDYEVTA